MNDHIAVKVEGPFEAIDLVDSIMTQAADDCRRALIAANLWATVTITHDNYSESV